MKELKQLLINLEINIDINVFFSNIDTNNDGKIDSHEFVSAASAGYFDKMLAKE